LELQLTALTSFPRVTIVVPNFNHARYLPESLGSIAAQTRAPDRVLIIDDASTDESLSVISRLAAGRRGWELIQHHENKGVVAGQNEALRQTDTDWIGFLGADDALHPTYIEKSLTEAAGFPYAGFICGCTELIGSRTTRALRPIMLPARWSGFLKPDDVRKALLVGDNYFSGTVSLYRRSALIELGGFKEELGSFADAFLARQLALTFGMYFIAEILGYWRIHGQNYSMRTSTDPKLLTASVRQIRDLIADDKLFPDGYDDAFERRTRFGAARIVFSAEADASAKAERAAALLGAGAIERWWLRTMLSLGGLGQPASLAWAALRTRPMSLARLLRQWPRRHAIIAAQAAYRAR
jgi:glycosyltransferase involved in cell wall biosynthesis